MSEPMPIIICGGMPEVVKVVKVAYLPEYEMIHAIFGTETAVKELPLLLQGQVPPPGKREQYGTCNYSKVAGAVIAGTAYDDEAWEKMRGSCKGISKVPWLRPDMSLPRPPFGPGYGEHMVARVKIVLSKLKEEGKMDEDVSYYF